MTDKLTRAERILELMDELGAEGLLMMEPREDFDPFVAGIVERFNDVFVVYDKDAMIDSFRRDLVADGMDYDEAETTALEHFSFNQNGGWYGAGTWGFISTLKGTKVPDPGDPAVSTE